MRTFKKLIPWFIWMFTLVACIPSGGFNTNNPVVATPGPTQSQLPRNIPPQNNLISGLVFLSEIQLLVMESYPVQIALHIKGEFPTPCHSFGFTIAEPNEKKEIHVDVYSLVEEGIICIQVIQPFAERVSIPMTGKPDGIYSIWVNGELIGEFSYPG